MTNSLMDNQQERLLWWFGGIIDGEGCITINHCRLHKNSHKETLLFSPIIVVVNTNKLLIDTCQQVLRDAQIPFWVQYYQAKPQKNCKEKWQIVIRGLKRVSKALTILSPYIISKSDEAGLVKRFCDLRLNSERVKTSYGSMGNAPYRDEEFDIIYEVAKIHNRNPQRLYAEIRNYKEKMKYLLVAKQDIVRPAMKVAE